MNSTTNSKEYKICTVLGGLDLARLVSRKARRLFVSALEDVEQISNYLGDVNQEQSHVGDFSSLQAMSQTLDWEARNLTASTTLEASLGYTDDRRDRRVDRYQSANAQIQPLVGDKQSDFDMVDSVSPLFPWLVDRRVHNNASLYVAAWVVSYAGKFRDAW